jgi:hypothetical protein
MRGLDPRIHLKKGIPAKRDGLPGKGERKRRGPFDGYAPQ